MLTASEHSASSQNVSRETLSPMAEYVALLLKWNAKINLIGPATQADIWSRHIDDSLQLVPLIAQTVTSLADLGSGAGLPGMVIAIARPELAVTLVEQDQRKAAFLTEAKHRLGLSNVTIKAIDIAALDGTYDMVTARALASLDMLFAMANRLLNAGGTCLFPKGENHAQEIETAQKNWIFKSAFHPSVTHRAAGVLSITHLAPINPSKNR